MYDNLIMNNNKIAIITGGNRGIGLGITQSFIEAGYTVFVGARKDRNLEETFGDKVVFVPTDVRQEQAHQDLVQLAIEKYGRLDVYVNNAGFSFWKPISEIEETFLSEILDTNLKGAFWGCKAASKVMKSKATIININPNNVKTTKGCIQKRYKITAAKTIISLAILKLASKVVTQSPLNSLTFLINSEEPLPLKFE